MRTALFGLALFGLAACDGWPTSMENLSGQAVGMSYQHRSYDYPSATYRFTPGQRTLLAREHRLRDMTEIRIIEGDRQFRIAGADLDRLKTDCPQYQCELIYQGDGVLIARPYQSPE